MIRAQWPRRVAALGQFRVLDPANPVLDEANEHHLRRVLRARLGEEVVVCDGRGTWSICEVTDVGLARVSDVELDEPAEETTLYLAALKADHAALAVAKATEVGVSRIVPLITRRGVVRFDDDVADKTRARWLRVAREAAAQCRRTYDVEVTAPQRVGEVSPEVAVADFDGSPDWRGVRAVAVGPEGGWDEGEWEHSRRRLSLGPSVLRAETAGVAAALLMAFQAGNWGFTVEGAK